MISADTAKRSCILCGRPEVPLLVKFRNLTVGRCPHCQAAMVLAIDAEGEPDADDYSARYEQERHNHKAGLCWDLLRRHTNGLDGVQSVLDIGCGEGEFLDLAKEAGLRTAGMDLSPEAVTIAALRGHQIFRHSATELLFPTRARFDVITMWDLLEHLTHPGRSLKLAYELLAPRGRLFVVTPMMGSIFDRVGLASHRMSLGRFDRLLKMCWTTEHLTRFHPAGIAKVLREIGFAEAVARPVQVLSLRPECYAGGQVMASWTRLPAVDRLISRCGVRLARALRVSNKILIEARRD